MTTYVNFVQDLATQPLFNSLCKQHKTLKAKILDYKLKKKKHVLSVNCIIVGCSRQQKQKREFSHPAEFLLPGLLLASEGR